MAELLVGAGLGTPAALLVARVAGAALLAIGLGCWLERTGDRGGRSPGLVVGLLAYNVAVPALLAYGALAESMRGIALWPACAVHVVLAIGCVAALRAHAPSH